MPSSDAVQALPSDYVAIAALLREIKSVADDFPITNLARAIADYDESSERCLQNLRISPRLYSGGKISSRRRIGLSKPIIEAQDRSHLRHVSFDPARLLNGVILVSVDVRKNTAFYLNRRMTPPASPLPPLRRPLAELLERAIPIVHSGSNVLLAALLRNAKNNAGSIPRSFLSSHNGLVGEGLLGSATRYASSFGLRHQPWVRKQAPLRSFDSSDDGIADFIAMMENKKELRVGQHSTNLSESLLRFQSMKAGFERSPRVRHTRQRSIGSGMLSRRASGAERPASAFDSPAGSFSYNNSMNESRSAGIRLPTLEMRSPSLAATNKTNAYADRGEREVEAEVGGDQISDLEVEEEVY